MTELALLVTRSEHLLHRSVLSEHHFAPSGHGFLCNRFQLAAVECGCFWTAVFELVTVCLRHIHYLQLQLWPAPFTPSLVGWSVSLQRCYLGTAGSYGPGNGPPRIFHLTHVGATTLELCPSHNLSALVHIYK